VDVGTLEVELTNAASAFVIADAVQIVQVGEESVLTIVSPSDLAIKTSADITIQALAVNFPSTWQTEFVLDGDTANPILQAGSSIELDPGTFPVLAGMSFSEHTIDARMVDGGGAPQTAFVRVSFGIGNYSVGFGDSFAFGGGDDDPADDVSDDNRNTGGGYQPILNNLLTAVEGVPQTIEREGGGGIESSDGITQVYSVLAAHPDVQRILILFGTNDSSPSLPVPSGLGLIPGDPGYPGTYKDNMQQIIDRIDPNGSGITPVIAKVPFRFGQCRACPTYPNPETHPKNLLIEEYNDAIDELKVINPLIQVMTGPPQQSDNFFTYFRDLPRLDGIAIEFLDNIHPNGVGYRAKGALWCETLTGSLC